MRLSLITQFLFATAGEAPPGGAPPGGAGGTPPPADPPAGQQPGADGAEVKMTSTALQARLEEERGKARVRLLKEYGLEKPDDLKGKLARLDELETARLSADERQKKALDDATAAAALGKEHGATAQAAVDALYATLTDAQRAVIDELAPATVGEKLRLITMARKLTGAAPAAAPPPGAPPAPAAPAPATTSPAPGAPKPGTPKTMFERWAAMPPHSLAAASFYRANGSQIEATRPTG